MPGILGIHTHPDKGITENLNESYLEFYVAGYTKKCKGVRVQANHTLLYTNSALLCNDTGVRQFVWPFGCKSSNIARIELIPEEDNKHDQNAIIVAVDYPLNILGYESGESSAKSLLYLGYVPRSINKIIKDKMYRLGPGWVKKTRLLLRKPTNHCTTKVAIPWDPDVHAKDEVLSSRLDSIVDNW